MSRIFLIGVLVAGCGGGGSGSHVDGGGGGDGSGGGDAAVPTAADLFAGEATIMVPHAFGLAIADLDHDGAGEVIVGASQSVATDPTVIVEHSAGAARTFTPTGYLSGSSVTTFVLADVDGDTIPDLVDGSSSKTTVDVLRGVAGGTFLDPAIASPTSASTPNIVVGRFDAGATLDVVVGPGQNDQQVSFLPGNGDGSFGAGTAIPIGARVDSIVSADWNGDGKPDIAASSFLDGGAIPLLGNGDGTFTAMPSVSAENPSYLAAADLDGDGKPDLVTLTPGRIDVALGNGDGTFAAPMQFRAGTADLYVALADVDGDGKLDAVAGDGLSDSIEILLGRGDGTFGPNIKVPYANVQVLAVGDIDGDGHTDLALIGNGMFDRVTVMFGK